MSVAFRRLCADGFIVIDAFNSDAIPVHLLTLEALGLYWSHLKPDGVLALHLTNNYLDLVPVASNLGASLGKEVLLSMGDDLLECTRCKYVVSLRDLFAAMSMPPGLLPAQ